MKNRKYRIVEYIDELGNVYYKIQHRKFGIWITDEDDFINLEVAEAYVKVLRKNNRKKNRIVKYL